MDKYIFTKQILFFIFLLSLTSCFSQIESGKIVYGIKISPSVAFKRQQQPINTKNFMNKVDDIITTFKFTLQFNKNESLFFMNNNLSIKSNEVEQNIAVLATRGKNKYYVSKKGKFLVEQTVFLGEVFLMKIPKENLKWKLVNEQKKIGKYLCYKAKAVRENSGPLNKEDKYTDYIAWYCPELPFNFGPFEVTGLPGLVLELSNEKIIYTAFKIKLSQEYLEINRLTKGIEITKDEFEKIGKKAFSDKNFINN